MKWFIKAMKQYADFSGRARREEYWMFVLFQFLFSLVAILLDGAIMFLTDFYKPGILPIYILYTLATCIPNLAVSVRRLHDTGNSGWMVLLPLVPVVGGIWLFVLYCTDSYYTTNQYGDNPKPVLF